MSGPFMPTATATASSEQDPPSCSRCCFREAGAGGGGALWPLRGPAARALLGAPRQTPFCPLSSACTCPALAGHVPGDPGDVRMRRFCQATAPMQDKEPHSRPGGREGAGSQGWPLGSRTLLEA